MLVVLSHRIDFESDYADELFRTYHYPSRYRNQLHEGDRFVYYQGNPATESSVTILEVQVLSLWPIPG